MTKTVHDVYQMPLVQQWTSKKVQPVDNPAPWLLYGLELEIENVWYNFDDPTIKSNFASAITRTEDGSLRNNGFEFVLGPMTYSHVQMVIEDFFKVNKFDSGNYSERCSIHVHTNVQDLTFEQLASLCTIYQVFERVLFRWIGNERERNIFCVPWYDTANMTYRVVDRIKNAEHWATGEWQKYTALNLLPVGTQGTIEWRHMEGNCDVKRIMQWLRFIGHMYNYAVNKPYDHLKEMLCALNSTSEYRSVIDAIFKQDADELKLPGYERDLEDGVLNMKYSIFSDNKNEKAKSPPPRELNEDDIVDTMVTITNNYDAEYLVQPEVNRAQNLNAAQMVFDEWVARHAIRQRARDLGVILDDIQPEREELA